MAVRRSDDPWLGEALLPFRDDRQAFDVIRDFVTRDRHLDLHTETAYVVTFRDPHSQSYERVTSREPLSAPLVRRLAAMLTSLREASFLEYVGVKDWGLNESQDRIWIGRTPGERLPSALGEDGRRGDLTKLLNTLAALASRNIVHGGLAPEAIAWQDDKIVLKGFGEAWLVAGQRYRFYDGLGRSVGDPRYMAPEVILGCLPSPASDTFSAAAAVITSVCGAVHPLGSSRELLGAEPLYRCLTPSSADWKARCEPQLVESLPDRIRQWLDRSLSPLPDDRAAAGASSNGQRPIAVSRHPVGYSPFRDSWGDVHYRDESSTVKVLVTIVFVAVLVLVVVLFTI